MRSMLLVLFLAVQSIAGANICLNGTFNATGSVTVPGPRINDTFESYQLTLSNLISESSNPDAPHVSVVWRTFELQTSPFQNFSDPTLPFTGCLIIIPTFPRAWANGIYDDGTCSSVLDPDCLAELITKINSTSSKISGTSSANDAASCTSIEAALMEMDNMNSTSKCSSHWSKPPYISLSHPDNSTSYSTCPDSANSTAIFKNGWTTFANEEGNYVAYDAALGIPTPMILTTWAKPGKGDGWAETKVFCVRGNQTIAAGSRDAGVANVTIPASLTSTATATSSTATSTKTSDASSSLRSVGLRFAFMITVVFGLVM